MLPLSQTDLEKSGLGHKPMSSSLVNRWAPSGLHSLSWAPARDGTTHIPENTGAGCGGGVRSRHSKRFLNTPKNIQNKMHPASKVLLKALSHVVCIRWRHLSPGSEHTIIHTVIYHTHCHSARSQGTLSETQLGCQSIAHAETQCAHCVTPSSLLSQKPSVMEKRLLVFSYCPISSTEG